MRLLLQWLRPAGKTLGWLLFGLVPFISLLLSSDDARKTCLLIGGFGLQVGGFGFAWREVMKALQEHEQPGIFRRIVNWWDSRPGKRSQISGVGGMATGGATASARASVKAKPKDNTVSERLRALEQNHDIMRDELEKFYERLKQEVRRLDGRVTEEAQRRDDQHSDVRRQLTSQAVGSADRELYGIYLFVMGSLSSTLAAIV